MHKLSVAGLVEQLVAGGRKGVISVPDTIFSIRRTIPSCEHTDGELEQLIAAIAISRHCNLSFRVPADLAVISA